MKDRLPAIYSKALAAWPDWDIKIPQLGDRSWKLASGGPSNPLQLDTKLNIDGDTVSFIDQMPTGFGNLRSRVDFGFADGVIRSRE